MGDFLSDLQAAKQKLSALHESEEYRKQCDYFLSESQRLTHSGIVFLENNEGFHYETTARREYASGCKYLHRGFYSPSLLMTKVLVGAKRGRLLKRLTSRSNPCFEYGFNSDNQLIWCNRLQKQDVVTTEHLLYTPNTISGFTVDSTGYLQTVTEEIYENDKLLRYTRCAFLPFGTTPVCYEISCEEYRHDPTGVVHCQWHFMTIPPQSPSQFLQNDPMVSPITIPIYRRDVYTIATDSAE